MYTRSNLKQLILLLMMVMGLFNNGHAEVGKARRAAEIITAFLRGTCSKVEYDLYNDTSADAHTKRMVIAMLRLLHGTISFINHDRDYHCYDLGWLALDGVDFFKNFYRADAAYKEDISIETGAKPLHDNNGQVSPDIKESNDDFFYLRKIILPEFERMGCLFIALSYDQSPDSVRNRFFAQCLVSLARMTQLFIDQEPDSLHEYLVGIVLFCHIGHVIYQWCSQNSGFRNWLSPDNLVQLAHRERQLRQSLQHQVDRIARLEADLTHARQQQEHNRVAAQRQYDQSQRDLVQERATVRQQGNRIVRLNGDLALVRGRRDAILQELQNERQNIRQERRTVRQQTDRIAQLEEDIAAAQQHPNNQELAHMRETQQQNIRFEIAAKRRAEQALFRAQEDLRAAQVAGQELGNAQVALDVERQRRERAEAVLQASAEIRRHEILGVGRNATPEEIRAAANAVLRENAISLDD